MTQPLLRSRVTSADETLRSARDRSLRPDDKDIDNLDGPAISTVGAHKICHLESKSGVHHLMAAEFRL